MAAREWRFQSPRLHQRGTLVVEFALVLGVFLLLLFGVLEVARTLYVLNMAQEVTRRAAAAAARTDFTDSAALQQLRQQAIFRSSPGTLLLGAPLADSHLQIDYLHIARAADGSLSLQPMGTMPASPVANRVACIADPYSDSCIQLVRVRLCATLDANGCQPVILASLFPLLNLGVRLPAATTIVKAESLGYPRP